ncbi:trigger factor [uncultured Arenimonas sp.]|uniref:trigger factor n=1 Tax=uncultured Arenimonas sp. TaxID=546226 RepID=UPI0030DCB078
MQVSLENTANLERRLTVSLPADRLEGAVGNRLREIARTANIKGFRKGKVPTKVIEQRFGPQVRSEAYGDLVRESLGEAIRQEKLQVAGNPEIKAEPEGEGGEIRYTATFEVVPEFGEIDPAKLEIERVSATIEESDIDTMIETLRQQRRSWEPVDSNVMYPELEQRLAGMKAGDEAEFEVTFPENWRNADLAGKAAKVAVKAIKVSAPKLPEVDEAFIKSFGIKGGKLETFRKEVRANLERELKGNLMQRLRTEVASKLVAAYADVELPPRLVEAEARNMAAAAQQQARQQGQANATFEAAQFKDAAHKRVAAGLLVGEIARQNKLTLDNKRLTETLQLIASTYEDPAQVVDLYRNDANLMSGLRNRVMEEQVIDWIAERAKATEKSISFTELMRPAA